MTEFKKTIGQYVDQDQAMLMFWNSLDPRSREIAMSDGLDSGDYKKLCDHIDLRYKMFLARLITSPAPEMTQSDWP